MAREETGAPRRTRERDTPAPPKPKPNQNAMQRAANEDTHSNKRGPTSSNPLHQIIIKREARASKHPPQSLPQRREMKPSSRALLRQLATRATSSSGLSAPAGAGAASASASTALLPLFRATPTTPTPTPTPAAAQRRSFASRGFGGGGLPPPPPSYSSRQARLPTNWGLRIVPEKTAFVVER